MRCSTSGRTAAALAALMAFGVVLPWIAEAQEVHWPPNFTYGHWCGRGIPVEPSKGPTTIDEIDAACKIHDFAYERSPWGNADADMELAQTLTDLLNRGTAWSRGADGQQMPRATISDRQFTAATVMTAYFSGQKFVTIYSDVVNGQLSSLLKLGTSSVVTSIAVPAAISNKLVTAFAKEVADVTGIPLDEVDVLQAGTDVTVEFVIEVTSLADGVVDEVGDVSESVVRKIGDVTGLDKPVREIREEALLLLTHPKKAIKRTGQKVIDCVLPWRLKKC